MIVASLASVIPVVASPFKVSSESIVAANVVASTVVSLKAIVVMPVALLNSLLSIAIPNISRSARLLDVIEVTLVKSTASVVNALIAFRSEADTAASSDEISIVYALLLFAFNNGVPPTSSLTREFPIVAVIAPVVKPSITFAWVTVKSSEIEMASSPKLSTPVDSYNAVTSSYVPEIYVTAVASIVTVVFPSIAERSSAVAVASADEITIV